MKIFDTLNLHDVDRIELDTTRELPGTTETHVRSLTVRSESLMFVIYLYSKDRRSLDVVEVG
jgi:hypothetical protein